MQRLIIVAIVLYSLAGNVVTRHESDTATGRHPEQETIQRQEPVAHPTMVEQCSQEHPCWIKDSSPENSLPRFARPEWVIVYVTLIYSVITWLTLLAIKQQANLMKSQAADSRESSAQATAIAKQAADAALINAQAVINAERPWIVVLIDQIVSIHISAFNVSVINKGRTPAFVLDSWMGYVIATNLDSIPETANYPFDTLIKDKLVLPDQRGLVALLDRKMVVTRLQRDIPYFQNEGMVFVYGRIRYRDLLNSDPNIIHETRWIGHYERTEEGDEIHSVEGIGLSSEYEQYT